MTGFVHRDGGRIVDGAGRELRLRGVGIGNWLLPEGYMWRFGPGAQSPREIEALIERMVGPDAAAEFWQRFQDEFFAEADVAQIAAMGFDHIRLPINSRIVMDDSGAFLDRGFQLIDRAIEWSRTHGLLVLLDLHGAPGGQTGTNIDDSPRNRPELFMDARYREQTIVLWTELARRYRDEPVVMGYDLLNEPIPNDWQHTYADALAQLYRDLTAAIRAVDAQHLIMYEGSHWATNWDIFTEVWDANSCLQFHKYWSSPDVASIQKFLDARDRLGLPIYMGEGGENNPEWLYAAFRLYEAHSIGWNFWPWKKVDTVTSPLSITPPDGWEDVKAMAGGGPAIERERAHRILWQLLDNLDAARCERRTAVLDAVFGRHPSVLPAWGFGYDGAGVSYRTNSARPLATIRADDDVTIDYLVPRAAEANVFEHHFGAEPSVEERLVVRLEAGDWLRYPMTGADAGYRALTPDGAVSPAVEIEPECDALKLIATGPATLWRIVR